MASVPDNLLRVALLHLSPKAGDIAFNRLLIEDSILKAANKGSDWVVTPELAVCGYSFAPSIGTDWIAAQPDPWMVKICKLATLLQIVVFLAVPEKDNDSGHLHNTVFVIGRDGAVCGKHRKINTLRVGSEAWSTAGTEATPIMIDGRSVGLMICADAYSPHIAKNLTAQGAQLLVSPAAWAPGPHGPDGEWERASAACGLPLFVCNRTGQDAVVDFTTSDSLVAHGGERLLSASSSKSVAFQFAWNIKAAALEGRAFRAIEVE